MVDRRLCYRDRFTDYLVNEITEDTSGDSINNELALIPDERQFLALEVTGEEYTKMFSALMTGADLAFTSEAHQIVWLLWKAAKMDSFCAAVTDAINNCADVQSALALLGSTNGGSPAGNPDEILPVAETGKNLLPAGYTCDQDHRFGMALAVVEALNTAVEEVFQAIEVLTNPLELANELADNVPLAGLVSTAGDIISWVQNTAEEAYTLAWSDAVRDEIACELFCAMLNEENECELTYDIILEVYKNISGVSVPDFSDWLAWVQFVVTVPLTAGVQVVKACSLFGLGAIVFGSKFGPFQLGLRTLETTIALAADDTSSDWTILCDDCGWYHKDDLTLGMDDWTIEDSGQWVNGQGFIVVDQVSGANFARQVTIRKAWVDSNITTIRVTLDAMYGSFGVGIAAAVLLWEDKPNGEFTQITAPPAPTGGTDLTYSVQPQDNSTFVEMLLRVSNMSTLAALNGSGVIKCVEFWGMGDNPFD